MTTARLNRIFTVTASSERTETSPIKWRYNAYGAVYGGGIGLWRIDSPYDGKWAFSRNDIQIESQTGILPLQGQGFGAFGHSAQDVINSNINQNPVRQEQR